MDLTDLRLISLTFSLYPISLYPLYFAGRPRGQVPPGDVALPAAERGTSYDALSLNGSAQSNIRHTTYDIRHMTYDIRHMTYDIRFFPHMTYDIRHMTQAYSKMDKLTEEIAATETLIRVSRQQDTLNVSVLPLLTVLTVITVLNMNPHQCTPLPTTAHHYLYAYIRTHKIGSQRAKQRAAHQPIRTLAPPLEA
jgi:hypothetical protein